MRRPLGLLNQKPSKNQGKGILECEGVEQLISCSLPGSWVTPLHTMAHNLTNDTKQNHTGLSGHQILQLFFCNYCDFYLLLDSYLDARGAGVSSQFRDERSSAGLPTNCIPTEPKGAGLGTGKHPAWARIYVFFVRLWGPLLAACCNC